MKKAESSTTITLRLPDSTLAKFDELCSVYGMKRSELVKTAIEAEHDRLSGNPEKRKLLEQLRELSKAVKNIGSQFASLEG